VDVSRSPTGMSEIADSMDRKRCISMQSLQQLPSSFPPGIQAVFFKIRAESGQRLSIVRTTFHSHRNRLMRRHLIQTCLLTLIGVTAHAQVEFIPPAPSSNSPLIRPQLVPPSVPQHSVPPVVESYPATQEYESVPQYEAVPQYDSVPYSHVVTTPEQRSYQHWSQYNAMYRGNYSALYAWPGPAPRYSGQVYPSGHHARFPYYSYRHSWYTPGPVSRNVTIHW